MTCGCPDRRPAAVTSRMNRRRSRSVSSTRLSTFTATSRPTASCQHRYTVAKPPAPRTPPTRCPGMSGAVTTIRQPSPGPATLARPSPDHPPVRSELVLVGGGVRPEVLIVLLHRGDVRGRGLLGRLEVRVLGAG